MEDRRKIRIGIIGLGLIAQVVHIPNLAHLSRLFEITSVCDLSMSLAKSVGQSLPGPPTTTTDWHEVVNSPDVDAVLLVGDWRQESPVGRGGGGAGLGAQ